MKLKVLYMNLHTEISLMIDTMFNAIRQCTPQTPSTMTGSGRRRTTMPLGVAEGLGGDHPVDLQGGKADTHNG